MTEKISQLLQNGNLLILILVFLSAILFAYGIANATSNLMVVRKRAANASNSEGLRTKSTGTTNLIAASEESGVLDVVLPRNEKDKSELRQFMNLAGYYSGLAPAVFQLSRILMGLCLGLITPFYLTKFFPQISFYIVTGASILMAALGTMMPKTFVSLKRDGVMEEHRSGFPDFLDLLVICVEAGIGIDSAIDRTGKEFASSYPSLAKNLQFMSSEMRAGRSLRDSLNNLATRLGIEEAKAFATLIQQTEELGSSLVQTMRIYSQEMRSKRFARAEAKAYSLPVKMVIPLGLFCFPVIMGVTMFPIALKISRTFVN